VSTLKRLKNFERSLFRRLAGVFGAAFRAIGGFLGGIRATNGRRVSILFMPHSESSPLRFRFSYPAFALLGVIVVAGAGFGLFSALRYSSTALSLDSAKRERDANREELDALRDEVGRLTASARRFEKVLSATIASAGLSQAMPEEGGLGGIGLVDSGESGGLREMREMARLTGYLDLASDPLSQIASLMLNQGRVMNEIPNIWPIRNGIGHVSMYFGQNENPFSGQWYIHNGIDISTSRSGDPVLASADGKVVQSGYDHSLGNYLILQHSHGFFTRYGHLQSFRATKGQKVQQGQVIAMLGNTGKTTGPHLHYEVHLGTSLIDPLKFLNIRSARAAGIK
jgi:murein DD-endopeptidase MepM/ murein hydrolase activator NlpD